MAWRKMKVEDQKRLFIQAYNDEKFNLSDLCKQFDISRTCGYKWIKRYKEEGFDGLKERSRVPFKSPNSTPDEIIMCIIVPFCWLVKIICIKKIMKILSFLLRSFTTQLKKEI